MDLSGIGLGAGLTFGARLGAKAAESTLDFANLLSQKIQGQSDSSTKDSSAGETTDTGDIFQAALNKFDQFLKNTGLAPEGARSVEFSRDLGAWHVSVKDDSLSSSQQQLIQQWQQENPEEARTLNMS